MKNLDEKTIVARTSIGDVLGTNHGQVLGFLGIPYAVQPVGELRFAGPRPLTKLPYDPFGATRVGAAPFQSLNGASSWIYETPVLMSEACLNLSIWTPSTSGKRPVLVWFHGGAWRTGHGGDAGTNGSALSAFGDIVVVCVTSRMGALGWLGHPDLADPQTGAVGSWGMQDQMEALRWVRQNIASFGGDPANVTAAGQSSGGQTIAAMAQYHSDQKLFDRAIIQSGVHFGTPRCMEPNQAFGYTERLAKRLGVTVPGLRTLEAAHLQREELLFSVTDEATAFLGGHRYLPFVDGHFIEGWPYERSIGSMPLMVGYTRNETNFFFHLRAPNGKYLANDIPSAEQLAKRVAGFAAMYYPFDSLPVANDVIEHYRACAGDSATTASLWLDITTDVDMRGHAQRAALLHAANGGPTFLYEFAEKIAPPGEGAIHCGEIPFLFGTFSSAFFAGKISNDSHASRLSEAMMQAWVSFARNGKPTLPGGGIWPLFMQSDLKIALFGGESVVEIVSAPRQQELAIWPEFIAL